MSENRQHYLVQHAPKPARLPSKAERTREAILAAAVDFVWDHAFHDLTVGELMARAKHSRPAFYQYFRDLYELMETLLLGLKQDIFAATAPWFEGEGNPLSLQRESLEGLVRVCYELGPVLRAVSDAATADDRMARSYAEFLGEFDHAVTARIECLQDEGWIPPFEPRPIAVALNRMDAAYLIHAFGRRPRSEPQPVAEALIRIWCSTLYGARRGGDVPDAIGQIPEVQRPEEPTR